tara:strand:+ start:387 stop:620 length:234 start_codon:yes stop_codon:yes gene_type:complete
MAENPQDAFPNPDRYEKCVICKNQTFIKKNQLISTRSFYIKGFGQSCHSCFFASNNISTTYNSNNSNIDDMYTYDEN